MTQLWHPNGTDKIIFPRMRRVIGFLEAYVIVPDADCECSCHTADVVSHEYIYPDEEE
jgi:hypothetical protein